MSIELTEAERPQLESWGRRGWRIVLACAEGQTNTGVAERLGVSRPTMARWRNRFAERRLDGLLDEPRPG